MLPAPRKVCLRAICPAPSLRGRTGQGPATPTGDGAPLRRGRKLPPVSGQGNPIDPPTPPIGRTVRPDIPHTPGSGEGWPIGHPPPGPPENSESDAEDTEPPEYAQAQGMADADLTDVIQDVGKSDGDDDEDGGGRWTLPEFAEDAGDGLVNGLQVAGTRTRQYFDEGPVCVQVSYYDRVGGGAGVCVDTAEQELLVTDEAGVGSGGGLFVDRPEELPDEGYCGLGGAVTSGGGGGYFLVGADESGDFFGDYSAFPGAGYRRSRMWSGGFGRETSKGRHVGRPGPWGWTSNDGGRHRGRPPARGQLGRYLAGTAQGKVSVTCGERFNW